MIPISVVSLVETYKRANSLESPERWFHDAKAQSIVVDDYVLQHAEFYDLLKHETKLDSLLLELKPEGLSYAEALLYAVHYLVGDPIDQARIKNKILTLSGLEIITYYLQWGWFRDYVDREPVKSLVKNHIVSTTRSLRWRFEYLPSLTRYSFIAERKDFPGWYFTNFYIGEPSLYCDLNRLVAYASTYYDFDLLEKFAQEPKQDKLTERGAVYEAIQSGKIYSLPSVSKEMALVILDLGLSYFEKQASQLLVLSRRSTLELEFYGSFFLACVLDYKLSFLQALHVFSTEEVQQIIDHMSGKLKPLPAGFGIGCLKDLRRVLLALVENGRSGREFSQLLLTKFLFFLVQEPEFEKLLEADGLRDWFRDLEERSIVIPNRVCSQNVCVRF
jgi:hypothetical protein